MDLKTKTCKQRGGIEETLYVITEVNLFQAYRNPSSSQTSQNMSATYPRVALKTGLRVKDLVMFVMLRGSIK